MNTKTLLVTILIICLSVLFACQSMYMRTAKLAIRDENDPDKAIEYLQKEIESNPTNVEAYLFMSKIYGQYKKDYISAYNYAKKALELEPQKEEEINNIYITCWAELYNQGLKSFNEKDFENSLQAFKEAVKIFPDSIKSKVMLANVYAKVDSSEEAIEIFIEIAEKLPNDIASRKTLANTYWNNKDYENAIKFFEELFNIEPQNADWSFNIAVCYSNLNNLEKAFEYYKKAIELDPQNKEIIYKIAHNEFNNENYGEAIKYYQKILEINENEIDAIEFIARSYWFIKDYENLIEYSKKWSELEPDNENAVLFMNLGIQKLEESKNK